MSIASRFCRVKSWGVSAWWCGRQAGSPGNGVQPVEVPQETIQLRVDGLKGERRLEESLRGDGEELGRVLGGVRVEQGLTTAADVGLHVFEGGAKGPRPGLHRLAAREQRRRIGVAGLIVERVRHFVEA